MNNNKNDKNNNTRQDYHIGKMVQTTKNNWDTPNEQQ